MFSASALGRWNGWAVRDQDRAADSERNLSAWPRMPFEIGIPDARRKALGQQRLDGIEGGYDAVDQALHRLPDLGATVLHGQAVPMAGTDGVDLIVRVLRLQCHCQADFAPVHLAPALAHVGPYGQDVVQGRDFVASPLRRKIDSRVWMICAHSHSFSTESNASTRGVSAITPRGSLRIGVLGVAPGGLHHWPLTRTMAAFSWVPAWSARARGCKLAKWDNSPPDLAHPKVNPAISTVRETWVLARAAEVFSKPPQATKIQDGNGLRRGAQSVFL